MEQSLRVNLPQKLYKAEQVRDNEALVAAKLGIEMFTLMEDAGKATFQMIAKHTKGPGVMTVICGYGNNGGDGYIVARLAKVAGWQVKLMQLGECDKLKGDAAKARALWLQYGGKIHSFDPQLTSGTVLVDAMLGSGLTGNVRGAFVEAIEAVNRTEHQLVCAVDIPSGLNADSGVEMGLAVVADLTCTFVGVKQGLLTGKGPDHCGKLYFAGLQIADAFEQMVPASVMRSDYQVLSKVLKPRMPSSHKGTYGHVLVIGGNKGMSGAVRMASRAALRAGAGLVSVYTHPDNEFIVASDCPEIMVGGELDKLLTKADVVVFGPGCGLDDWGAGILQKLLPLDKPMVIDADGLNLLAQLELKDSEQSRSWVLTPHPKEASRLAGTSVAEIQRDRFAAVRTLAQKYASVVLLKGAGTLIADSKGININTSGNPGMATAGMGDVLSGIIGGLLAQGVELFDAAAFGAMLHGMAADKAAQDGQRGMMATDLLPFIRSLIN